MNAVHSSTMYGAIAHAAGSRTQIGALDVVLYIKLVESKLYESLLGIEMK